MKKTKSWLFTLLVGLLAILPFQVNAETTVQPEMDSNNVDFFANGVAIEIKDRTDGEEGSLITWDGGSATISSDVRVFGGGKEGTSYPSSNITVSGGNTYRVIGGGRGTKDTTADVTNVTIKMTDGYVNGISGGGILSSKVEKANIEVTGGQVANLIGGGFSTSTLYSAPNVKTYSGDAGTKAEPEKSANAVNETTINLTNGTFYDTGSYGLVYGGGQGNGYVKKSTVNISGTADLSNTWLVGGGSNGRTDDSTLNISGGTINTVQTINRGSMIDAHVNVTGGKISTLYAGGEDPETFDKDVVNGGFLGNIIVDITGGTVESLQAGSNYDESIEPNADYVTVFYKEESVTNASDLTEIFGNSAKIYVTEEGTDIAVDFKEEDTVLKESFLEALAKTENVYTLIIEKGDISYGWVFQGTEINDPSIEVNTEMTLTEEAPEEIATDVNKEITGLENVMYLNLKHSGKLPGKAHVIYYVGEHYEDGTKLYVRHFNETTKKLEEAVEVEVKDGVITFEIEECSSYVLSTTADTEQTVTPTPENPNTGDNLIGFITLFLISIAGITVSIKKLAHNK